MKTEEFNKQIMYWISEYGGAVEDEVDFLAEVDELLQVFCSEMYEELRS